MENTNTLFRFATLRTPDFIKNEDRQKFFSFCPLVDDIYFIDPIRNPQPTYTDQTAYLKSLADNFKLEASCLYSENDIKTIVGEDFYNYSVWLAQNKSDVAAYTTISTVLDDYFNTLEVLEDEPEIAIWNNLLFQLVSNQSSTLRQLYIDVLVANHLLVYKSDVDNFKIALSTVVIPPTFWGLQTNETAIDDTRIKRTDFNNNVQTHYTNIKLNSYNSAIDDFKIAEEIYNKSNQETFETALANYNSDVADAWVGVPEPTEEEPNPQPENLPTFSYVTPKQIDEEWLSERLSDETKKIASELKLYNCKDFVEVYQKINDAIIKRTTILYNGTNYNEQIIVGAGVALAKNGLQMRGGKQYKYCVFLLPSEVDDNAFIPWIDLDFGTDDAPPPVEEASFIVTIDGVAEDFADSSLHPIQAAYNPQHILILLNTGTVIQSSNYATTGTFNLSGTFVFNDGTTTMNFNIDIPLSHIRDTTNVIPEMPKQCSYMEIEGSEDDDDTTYTSAKYGITRLGVADYRRVEQTVCCYLPGEVSHIENIMAKEYKQKTTSRLHKTEETTTTEQVMEKENITDTSTTTRNEINQEISSIIQQDTQVGTHIGTHFKAFKTDVSFSADFAHHNSSQQSNSQAISYAKEITERATERVTQRVKQEKIIKVTEEFIEKQEHSFDNREGDKHITGVYRFIDKVYKNQVYNYGKRLMYEFMIPEPANFHNAAMQVISSQPGMLTLEKPIDPRSSVAVNRIASFNDVSEANVNYWASAYNVKIDSLVSEYLRVGSSVSLNDSKPTTEMKIEIPEGYRAKYVVLRFASAQMYSGEKNTYYYLGVVTNNNTVIFNKKGSDFMSLESYQLPYSTYADKELVIGFNSREIKVFSITIQVTVFCERTPEKFKAWQVDTFNKIITAYQQKQDAYDEAYSRVYQNNDYKTTNPAFYRQIENVVLRKNCIHYLIGQENMGKNMMEAYNSVQELRPRISSSLGKYAALVKFIEQAFEWNEMSYSFYPFYWANKDNWAAKYQQDVDDELFRNFLQAGMARVILSVRPGFEAAVMYFIATGLPWNGGDAPIIGDDLYLSIIQELKAPTKQPEESWETRLPSSLTIIQQDSVGLTETGLPCSCGTSSTLVAITDKLAASDNEVPIKNG